MTLVGQIVWCYIPLHRIKSLIYQNAEKDISRISVILLLETPCLFIGSFVTFLPHRVQWIPTFCRDVGGERLLSDSRRCLVKPIIIGCCVGLKGVRDVIKQARRAAAQKSGPGEPLDF